MLPVLSIHAVGRPGTLSSGGLRTLGPRPWLSGQASVHLWKHRGSVEAWGSALAHA